MPDAIPDLFEISGYMELNNAELRGVPLKPEQLFAVLDLSRPGLGSIKAATERGDAAAAQDMATTHNMIANETAIEISIMRCCFAAHRSYSVARSGNWVLHCADRAE